MRLPGSVLAALALLFIPAWADESSATGKKIAPTLEQQYLAAYTEINQAEQLRRDGEVEKALPLFYEAANAFLKIQEGAPEWEPALVLSRMRDCRAEIGSLSMTAMAREELVPPSPAGLFSPLVGAKTASYPWKPNILTTIFWIGEDLKGASAWNARWVQDNHGPDDPEYRNGYAPAGHASDLNTFYVALPFNDLAHPDLAKKWLPAGWLSMAGAASACQHRWIEIKNATGEACYAQWEEVGPGRSDDGAYVFGSTPPRSEPALCVSPAVADYLDLRTAAHPAVSWRFVDAAGVVPGKWLKYDEEAVLFTALHESEDSRGK